MHLAGRPPRRAAGRRRRSCTTWRGRCGCSTPPWPSGPGRWCASPAPGLAGRRGARHPGPGGARVPGAYQDRHGLAHTTIVLPDGVRPPPDPRPPSPASWPCSCSGPWPASPCVVHGDGTQARDLLYVDDAVDALVKALDRADGATVEIGTGEATTIAEPPGGSGPRRPASSVRQCPGSCGPTSPARSSPIPGRPPGCSAGSRGPPSATAWPRPWSPPPAVDSAPEQAVLRRCSTTARTPSRQPIFLPSS